MLRSDLIRSFCSCPMNRGNIVVWLTNGRIGSWTEAVMFNSFVLYMEKWYFG